MYIPTNFGGGFLFLGMVYEFQFSIPDSECQEALPWYTRSPRVLSCQEVFSCSSEIITMMKINNSLSSGRCNDTHFLCFWARNHGKWKFSDQGFESELQLLACTPATATWDPSRICDLHHSSQQCRIPNPLKDQTHILMDTSQFHFCCSTMRTEIHTANNPYS